MSNKTRLQTNNNNLQTILNTVNSLPSGGSGGGSIETVTVNLNFNNNYEFWYSNGQDIINADDNNASITVLKNSILVILFSGYTTFSFSGGVSLIRRVMDTWNVMWVKVEGDGSINESNTDLPEPI